MLTVFFPTTRKRERERAEQNLGISKSSLSTFLLLLYRTLLYYLLNWFNPKKTTTYCTYFMSVGSRFVAPGESGCRKRAREPLFAPRRYASALEPWTATSLYLPTSLLLPLWRATIGRGRCFTCEPVLLFDWWSCTFTDGRDYWWTVGGRRLGRTLVSLAHGAKHCC